MVAVKICGLTNFRDTLMSIELGGYAWFQFLQQKQTLHIPLTLFDIQNCRFNSQVQL